MASDKIVNIDATNWDSQVLKSSVPVLVDFWAEWCGPCRAISPILDQLAEELSGKVKICKVDVDKHQALAGQFGVRSIPTMLVIKSGVVQEQMVGAMSKNSLQEKLSAHLG